MMKRCFILGDLGIIIDSPVDLPSFERLDVFEAGCENDTAVETEVLRCRFEDYGKVKGVHAYRISGKHRYYFLGEMEIMVHFSLYPEKELIWCIDKGIGGKDIYISPDIPPACLCLHEILKHVDLTGILSRHGRYVLHSCYVKKDGRAILFSGDPGDGKSTQGSLWERYGDAEVINGDRSLIYKDHLTQKYYAGGYFYCGSSGICKNESLPIAAIVFLEKGKENVLCHLSKAEAIKRLYLQLSGDSYFEKDVDIRLSFLCDLVDKIPVYLLRCRIDRGAVDILKDELTNGTCKHLKAI